jgi:hypothetical protein
MIEVEQTIFTIPGGDCFAACVASILELPINAVPNFPSEDGDETWWHSWQEWLKPRNLAFLGWPDDNLGSDAVRADTLRGYSILTVHYGGKANHSCVALDGELVWNPHPARNLRDPAGVVDWMVFRVLDPSKPIVKSPGN